MELKLRAYQEEALARIERAATRGVRRQMGVAATGLGKTVMFCALAERMGVRTLVVAHRDELIEQAAAKVREVWRGARVGIVKGERNEVDAQVVVASIQTLARPKRLADLLAPTLLNDSPSFGLVVIDEAHHAAAQSYRDVIHGLRCDEPDGPLLLGVTATPDRGDGKGLDDLFEQVVFSYDLRWGIANEYLSDLKGLRVRLGADFAKLKVTAGDYNAGAAGRMLEDADAPDAIARAYVEHAKGRRTIVFTPTVATAEATTAAMIEYGVAAATVSGEMPIDERRAALAAYSRGDLDVLANCAVLTEGYDEPRTDCIIVARPTKSRALYTQMVGRGTRKHPDKADCLVIDVVGASDVHALVTAPSLFGIEDHERAYDMARTLSEALRDQIDEHERTGKLLASEMNLFEKVRALGKMAWVALHRPGALAVYSLSLGEVGDVRLLETGEDAAWQATLRPRSYGAPERVLIDYVTQETAQAVAEDYARKSGAARLASTDAPWRQAAPTPKQRALLGRLGVNFSPGISKGEASDLITAALASKR